MFLAWFWAYYFPVSMHYVYIARCKDGSLYTGTCVNVREREAAHNAGRGAKYTRARRPVRIVYTEEYNTLSQARRRETEIKRWPLATKQALLRFVPLSHAAQRTRWNAEHRAPNALPQMNSEDASRGVTELHRWLMRHKHGCKFSCLEMGSGKGRNSIWLARQGLKVTGFDFSPHAVTTARNRAKQAGVHATFLVADATKRWPLAAHMFDVGIDCFASSDIESASGRAAARAEFLRVLRPGGYLLVYAISHTSPFHRAMQRKYPAAQFGGMHHPNGKFEKMCSWPELAELYEGFSIVQRRTLKGESSFYGRRYRTENLWLLLQVPRKKKAAKRRLSQTR